MVLLYIYIYIYCCFVFFLVVVKVKTNELKNNNKETRNHCSFACNNEGTGFPTDRNTHKHAHRWRCGLVGPRHI